MSSSPRPPKRPRHSQSTSASTLRAPFKSPLRPRDSNSPASSLSIPSKHAATTTDNAIANGLASTKVTTAASEKPCQPAWRATSKKRKIDHHVAANNYPAEQRSREEEEEGVSAAPSPAEDDLISLQRTHTRLLNTLAASKRDLETARQAQKLEASSCDPSRSHPSSIPPSSSSRPTTTTTTTTSNDHGAVDTYYGDCAENGRLKDLIGKWRGASREAAEVVYASAKARVEGMGGMRGIRAREVDKWRWFREEERAEQGVEKRKEKERERKVVDMDEEQEEEESDVAEGAEEDGEQDEDDDEEGGGGDYTMGMMLQGFGIQLETLGWDDDGGKWID